MITANLPALQVVLPLLAAPICAMVPARRIVWAIAIAVTAAVFAISVGLFTHVMDAGVISYQMGGWKPPFGIEYRVDGLNAFFLMLVSGIGLITVIYSPASASHEIASERHPLFYVMFLLCMAGLLGILITNDAFNIYVFLEISSLATYALIAMGQDRRALTASLEYLILGSIGATFILIAVGLLYMVTGTLNITDLSVQIVGIKDSIAVQAALAFFVIGVAMKAAVFPLHVWLTNAYTNAPSFVSAFLSATATKVSLYVLVRLIFSVFGVEFTLGQVALGDVLLVFGLIAALAGAVIAIYQRNVKRILAYSSVSQIGYLLVAIGLASHTGVVAFLSHVAAHALAKSALFMVAGCVIFRCNAIRLHQWEGLGKVMPWTMAAFVLSGFSLMGVPLTFGFVSKWYLLMATVESGLWVAFAVLAVSSVLALIYMWRVFEVIYFKAPSQETQVVKEAPLALLLPLWVLVLLTVGFGIWPAPVVDAAQTIATYLFDLNL
jgi:multicomponent Na+:H+ antiporter subunit D